MRSGEVSKKAPPKPFPRHLNLSIPSRQRQTEMATRSAHNKNNAGEIITGIPINSDKLSDNARSGETHPPRGQGAGQ